MKILITGGAGFIGSHIVDACVERGDEVFIIDNLSTGQRGNMAHHDDNTSVHFYEVDIRDWDKISDIFERVRPEVVFHLAAQINVRESMWNPLHDVEVNILGTTNILEAMRNNNCKRMIFSSTGGAMFGGDNPPYSESHEAHPETPYGISKRTVELLLEFYERQYGIRSTTLRYANVYWSRQNARGEAGVISIFLDKIQNNQIPTIYGDGSQTRDFIHVSDVVLANIHALEKNLTGIYHVGTGIETSVNELWSIVASSTDTSINPHYVSSLGEIQRSALSPEKLLMTGWDVTLSLRDGIQQMKSMQTR